MKRIYKALFSTRIMTALLLLFGISMAVATFVENDYDTATAKALIYNSTWFEILMLWLIFLFIANIKTYRLMRREKWPLLAFHLAFVLIFTGGAITRYISFEGQMPIKINQVTNEIITDQTYFKLNVTDGKKILRYEKYPYMMSHLNAKNTPWPFKRTFRQDYQFGETTISLRSLDYIPLAKDSIRRTSAGKKLLHIVSMDQQSRSDHYISDGEVTNIKGMMFSYNNPLPGTVQLRDHTGVMQVAFPTGGEYMSMSGQQKGVISDSSILVEQSGQIQANEWNTFDHRTLYTVGNTSFVIPEPAFRGEEVFYVGDKNDPADNNLLDVVRLEVASGKEKDTVLISGGKGVTEFDKTIGINGLTVSLGYGSKVRHTDFYLRCDAFTIDRYPGSGNPSSYESKIAVVDKGEEKQHDIYMNNVMDYHGYRFFQASYFPDESGTILSVNADRWGTKVTYTGYFLLFAGMFFTLFWKGTRFWKLNESLKKMRAATVILFLLVSVGMSPNVSFAQTSTPATNETQSRPGADAQFIKKGQPVANRIIDRAHAVRFGYLLTQDFEGRIKPVNTHALELLRKIHKKDSYTTNGITLTPEQWFISMQIDPGYWANEPLIKVSAKGGDRLHTETGANADGYTSYSNLVDRKTGEYKLKQQDNEAFGKRKADQSNYDKEVILITERFNIFSSIAFGYHTRIIPVQNDPAHTWRSWIYNSGEKAVEIDEAAYAVLTPYFDRVKTALQTGNYEKADQAIESIADYQKQWGGEVMPSTAKVSLEVLYNHLNVFFWLMIVYSLLGVCLIMLGFAQVFSSGSKYYNTTRLLGKALLAVMVLALAIQFVALAVRWYLSGHAPWSNGYEAIVFISGVAVVAGLLLYKNRNAFIPAAGALVAMIMMGFAHGGSMLDPQITPLEPVLKSYWLMVHVGIITSSYGFFGLSAVLSIITLILFSAKSTGKTTHSIQELTLVNEMALTVGIFTLAVGTFLGGMWANESWGRYWSWDPKETWAFISVIIYSVVLHLRLVPKLRGGLTFNIASMWAVWSIIFTYFGVNYYLSGLHSYAAGDPIPVPMWIYLTAAGMTLLSAVAYFKCRRAKKPGLAFKGKVILKGKRLIATGEH